MMNVNKDDLLVELARIKIEVPYLDESYEAVIKALIKFINDKEITGAINFALD